MDFAAAAVFDPVAAAPPARPAPADEANPTFDDHLAAQQPEAHEPASREEFSEAARAQDQGIDQQAQPAIVAAPTAPNPAAPVVLQLALGDAPAPQTLPNDTPTEAIAPSSDSHGLQQAAPPTPPQPPFLAPVAARASDPSEPKNESAKAAAIVAPEAPAPVLPIQAAPEAHALAQQDTTQQQGEAALDALAAIQAAAQGLRPARALKGDTARASDSSASSELDAEQTPRANPTDTGKAQGKTAAQPPVFATQAAVEQRPAAQDAPVPQLQSVDASMVTPQGASHTQQIAIDAAAVRAAPVAAQISREIVRRFNGQNTQFDLRLDPPELGRVEIRLEVTRDHRVTAIVAADNPQALAELARNARELEQSLQSAGLQLAENGLSFDLRQGRGGSRETNNEAGGTATFAKLTESETPAPTPLARPVGFERWRGVRLDIVA